MSLSCGLSVCSFFILCAQWLLQRFLCQRLKLPHLVVVFLVILARFIMEISVIHLKDAQVLNKETGRATVLGGSVDVKGPDNSMLREIFYTGKHEWYPRYVFFLDST